MATRKNKLLEFIKEHKPKFEQKSDGSWQIFTVATQHVNKPTLEECIKFCYYVIEKKPILKYPTLSELCGAFRAGKLEGEYFHWRNGEVGYRPGFTTKNEIAAMCQLSDEISTAQMQIMWGKGNKSDKLEDKSNEMLWNIKDT